MNDYDFKRSNTLPFYTEGEELINYISHGIGACLAIFGLILMILKSDSNLERISSIVFGSSMIILYTNSSIYHALSPKIKGKKVLRVLDHVSVYLLVLGTFFPIAFLGIRGIKSIILISFVSLVTLIGIILTCINIDKFQVSSVICHLINGWIGLIGIVELYRNIGFKGVLFLILGGVMYSIGAIIYGPFRKIKYMHSLFHFFCIAGTIFHFICIYFYIL